MDLKTEIMKRDELTSDEADEQIANARNEMFELIEAGVLQKILLGNDSILCWLERLL